MMKVIVLCIPVLSALRMSLPQTGVEKPYSKRIPGGTDIVWQKPPGEIKGTVLWIHGCGGRSTDMWSKSGFDGHELAACARPKSGKCPMDNIASVNGYENGCCPVSQTHVLARQKARHRGYLVVGMQMGDDKTRCPHARDVVKVSKSLEWLQENVGGQDKPVFVMGFSAGGGHVPLTTEKIRGNCAVLISSVSRHGGIGYNKLEFPPFFPKKAPVLFIYDETINDGFKQEVATNRAELDSRNIVNAKLVADWRDQSQSHHWNGVGDFMEEAIDFCETKEIPEVVKTQPLGLAEWQAQKGFPNFVPPETPSSSKG